MLDTIRVLFILTGASTYLVTKNENILTTINGTSLTTENHTADACFMRSMSENDGGGHIHDQNGLPWQSMVNDSRPSSDQPNMTSSFHNQMMFEVLFNKTNEPRQTSSSNETTMEDNVNNIKIGKTTTEHQNRLFLSNADLHDNVIDNINYNNNNFTSVSNPQMPSTLKSGLVPQSNHNQRLTEHRHKQFNQQRVTKDIHEHNQQSHPYHHGQYNKERRKYSSHIGQNNHAYHTISTPSNVKTLFSSSTKSVMNASLNDYSNEQGQDDNKRNELNRFTNDIIGRSSMDKAEYKKHLPQQPVYEVIINEEERDLPKKLFQVKALMINEPNANGTWSANGRSSANGQDNGKTSGLMFILSGTGVDYEHPERSKFAINAFTGELFLIKPLDRDGPDGRDLYRLVISAEDERSERINGSVLVLVRVRDINDNQPYFEQSNYRALVPENAGPGVDVVRVHAIDLDSDSIVRYSIEMNRVNSEGDLIFDIDELSGLVSTAVCCLDRESIRQYTIKICATDRSINGQDDQAQSDDANRKTPSSFANHGNKNQHISNHSCTNVQIDVQDENDEAPRFIRDRFYLFIPDGVNELHGQRILLNTSVFDNDLPETNRFVCRLDLNLGYPLYSPASLTTTSTKANQTSEIQFIQMFWAFITNETNQQIRRTNLGHDLSQFRWVLLFSGSTYHSSMSKYFQCHINKFGQLRVQVLDNFSRKYFHQLLIQEFEHFRSGLWNQFWQNIQHSAGGLLPSNMIDKKYLIPLPDWIEIFIKISVSDLGLFDVPSATMVQQEHLANDLSGLLDTHVINAEFQLKLSTKQPTQDDSTDKETGADHSAHQIINKHRIYDDGSSNGATEYAFSADTADANAKRSRETSKMNANHSTNQQPIMNGSKRFIQSIVGHISWMRFDSKWLLLVSLAALALLLMVTFAVLLFLSRVFFVALTCPHPLNKVNQAVDEEEDDILEAVTQTASLVPMLMASPSSPQNDKQINQSISDSQVAVQPENKITGTMESSEHHLFYRRAPGSDQLAPTTTTPINVDQKHLVHLFNTDSDGCAARRMSPCDPYGLYEIAQLNNTDKTIPSIHHSNDSHSSTQSQLIEMDHFEEDLHNHRGINDNNPYYNDDHHHDHQTSIIDSLAHSAVAEHHPDLVRSTATGDLLFMGHCTATSIYTSSYHSPLID